MTENNQSKNLPIIIAVAVVILIGGGATWYFSVNQPKPTTNTNSNVENVALSQPSSPTQTAQPEVTAPTINPVTNPNSTNTSNTSTPSEVTTTTPTTTTTPAPTTTTTTTPAPTTKYKDGSYTASGSYSSPAGAEDVSVQATLKDDKITVVSITPKATNSKSIRYQESFSQGISGKIVGKSLGDNLNPGVVNGSSLTATGFVQAMDAIKLQAAQK